MTTEEYKDKLKNLKQGEFIETTGKDGNKYYIFSDDRYNSAGIKGLYRVQKDKDDPLAESVGLYIDDIVDSYYPNDNSQIVQEESPTIESDKEEIVPKSDNKPNENTEKNTNSKSTTTSGSYGTGKNVSLANNKSVNYNKYKQAIEDINSNQYAFNSNENPLNYVFTGKNDSNTISSDYDNRIESYTPNNHSDYWPPKFQNILDNVSDKNYDFLAKQFQSDVNYLTREYSNVQDKITEWSGKARKKAKETMDIISDKLRCTMDNIYNSLEPACEKLEILKEQMEELKKCKEELTGADGNGGLDKELILLKDDFNKKEIVYVNLKSSEPSTTVWDPNLKKNVNNDAHTVWENNLRVAQSEMNIAMDKVKQMEEQIKIKEEKLNNMLEDVVETYTFIQNLSNQINSFKEYFGNGSMSKMFSDSNDFMKNLDIISSNLSKLLLNQNIDYSKTSPPVLADITFFEGACKKHASEGWKIEDDVVTMIIDGKECKYDMKKHLFSNTVIDEKGKQKKIELEAYFYLPSHIVESNDYSQLENINTYTFFSSNSKLYKNTIDNREIGTVTMMVIKSDPFNEKYDTLTNITKMGNAAANTDLTKCHNSIGGDSIYGAHSLKIAARNGDLYDTVYCVDNAAIIKDENGKKGTKEQFESLQELSGLDNKNIYFINVSGDDNYSTYADLESGRAYVSLSNHSYVSKENVKKSFTYTGIELVAQTCPNFNIHIVYQDQDTKMSYQRDNFPAALNELASRYDNITNDSEYWDLYASKKYQTHSQGNYIPHDLVEAAATLNTKDTNIIG